MKKKNGGYYYTLTFSLKFNYQNDHVYVAHCFPYTYSQLIAYLNKLEKDALTCHHLRVKTMCQTIADNDCPLITISEYRNGKVANKSLKRSIVLTSRVHPGETQASYMIEGIIDFLVGPSREAQMLRESFVFKIVPMLNPDGVINGNYRCNLAGVDLNRQWMYPSKEQHPTVFYTKQMVKKYKEENSLVLFVDIHGHSRKKNLFMYGCSGKDKRNKEMLFPLLMQSNSEVLSFSDCSFSVPPDKEGSARVALWRQFDIVHCHTMEASFCGADYGKYEHLHFNLQIFREIGASFCITILECFDSDQVKAGHMLFEIQNIVKQQQFEELQKQEEELNSGGGGTKKKKKKKTDGGGGSKKEQQEGVQQQSFKDANNENINEPVIDEEDEEEEERTNQKDKDASDEGSADEKDTMSPTQAMLNHSQHKKRVLTQFEVRGAASAEAQTQPQQKHFTLTLEHLSPKMDRTEKQENKLPAIFSTQIPHSSVKTAQQQQAVVKVHLFNSISLKQVKKKAKNQQIKSNAKQKIKK